MWEREKVQPGMMRHTPLNVCWAQAKRDIIFLEPGLDKVEDGDRIVAFGPVSGHPYRTYILIDSSMNVQTAKTDQVLYLGRTTEIAFPGCGFKPLEELKCIWWGMGAFELLCPFHMRSCG